MVAPLSTLDTASSSSPMQAEGAAEQAQGTTEATKEKTEQAGQAAVEKARKACWWLVVPTALARNLTLLMCAETPCRQMRLQQEVSQVPSRVEGLCRRLARRPHRR